MRFETLAEMLFNSISCFFDTSCNPSYLAMLGIHVKRDSLPSIAYSEELISATISATLQSTDRHHGIVGQKCSHFQRDS